MGALQRGAKKQPRRNLGIADAAASACVILGITDPGELTLPYIEMILAADRRRTADRTSLMLDTIIAGTAHGPLKSPAKAVGDLRAELERMGE